MKRSGILPGKAGPRHSINLQLLIRRQCLIQISIVQVLHAQLHFRLYPRADGSILTIRLVETFQPVPSLLSLCSATFTPWDSDQLPGSAWPSSPAITTDISTPSVSNLFSTT